MAVSYSPHAHVSDGGFLLPARVVQVQYEGYSLGSKLLSARERKHAWPLQQISEKKKRVDEPQAIHQKSCQHIMGPPKALARSASSHSDLDSQSEDVASNSDSGSASDSDSLDSQAGRKRRKISPPLEADAPLVPTTSVPSRIKSRVQENGNIAQTGSGPILAPVDSTTTFSALDVKPWLVGSLGAMAIKRPTGIQKGCIPEILKGRDCIGGSRTGSGKTVAFAVPILQKWAEDPFGIFALVLTPTR